MRIFHYFILLFFILNAPACIIESFECRSHQSFLEEPITTTELTIECICENEDNLFLSEQLMPYRAVKKFDFYCESENLFDDIPVMDSVETLNSFIITENIVTAFPNLKSFQSSLPRPILNTQFLSNLSNLKHLSLYNPDILPDTLRDLSLETFNLVINDKIAPFPNNLNSFSNLTSLEIEIENNQNIGDLSNLTRLRELTLIGNNLTIPSTNAFLNLDSLETIIIYGLSILSQSELFKAPNTKSLIYYGDAINESLGQMQSLNFLLIQGSSIPTTIDNLLNLKTLRIYQMDSFPNEILGLSNHNTLEMLTIGSGQISTIPIEIANFISVKEMNFANNNLTSLPSEIQNLAGTLEKLTIYNNNLSEAEQQKIRVWLPNTQITF